MSFNTFKFLKYDSIKSVLKRMIYSEGMTPLKHSLTFAVTFLFFFDEMTLTTVSSYLPKLVKTFGASEVEAGKDVGYIASSLYLTRFISSILWGYLLDKFDKKNLLLISCAGVAISTFAFGFSSSFTWTFVTRLLQGTLSGVVVITKTIMIDISDDTNVSLAMSFLITGLNLGLIIGPSLSAVLAFPGEQYPKTFSEESFFAEYAIFLPNLVITIGFVIGIVWGLFVIPKGIRAPKHEKICLVTEEKSELDDVRERHDYFMNLSLTVDDHNTSETSSLLIKSKNTESLFCRFVYMLKYSSIGRVLRSKVSLSCVILYGVYGIIGIGFREISPVFLATSIKYGGVGMTVFDISILMLIYDVILVVVQLGASKLQFWFGAKKTFIGCILVFAFMTPLLPLSALIKNSALRWIFLMIVQVSVNAANNVCFICINIFLANSVGPDLVGTVNGLGMSVSSVGRALGPMIFGFSYSWSLSNTEYHRLGFPFNQYFAFFLISIFCFLNLVYVYLLIPTSLNKRSIQQDKTEIVIRLKEYIHC